MSDDYLLFYSNKCLHSKDFLTILSKDVKLNQKFTKINIDNKSIKLPPYVKAVPSAIITVNGQPQLLVGTAIFKWYAETHKKAPEQQQQQNAILDWDPMAMTGYSDGFSYIDNSNDPQKKSFAFLGGNDGSIYTPDEKSFGGNDDKKSGGAKTELDLNYEKLMNNRNHEVPNAPTRL
jgi:hypothetical protein